MDWYFYICSRPYIYLNKAYNLFIYLFIYITALLTHLTAVESLHINFPSHYLKIVEFHHFICCAPTIPHNLHFSLHSVIPRLFISLMIRLFHLIFDSILVYLYLYTDYLLLYTCLLYTSRCV